MDVYDILGQEIKTLVDERREVGVHELKWEGTNDRGKQVTSGVYLQT
jgi:flagellar hook assembly protein FlgD